MRNTAQPRWHDSIDELLDFLEFEIPLQLEEVLRKTAGDLTPRKAVEAFDSEELLGLLLVFDLDEDTLRVCKVTPEHTRVPVEVEDIRRDQLPGALVSFYSRVKEKAVERGITTYVVNERTFVRIHHPMGAQVAFA